MSKTTFDIDAPILTAAQIALADDPFLPARDRLIRDGCEWAETMAAPETMIRYAIYNVTAWPRDLMEVIDDSEDCICLDRLDCFFIRSYREQRHLMAICLDANSGDSDDYRHLCAADDQLEQVA